MRSLADGLPADVVAELPSEWFANERAYWENQPQLLAQYGGQWVAFADGAVIAAGTVPVEIYHQAASSNRHPFVARVGAEFEPTRMRRATFAYDTSYPGAALPQLPTEFRVTKGTTGPIFSDVIPDTGSDASALPWRDCRAMGLTRASGIPAMIGGVAGSSAPTLVFSIWVQLDGREYGCQLQADFSGQERILGRDVLNSLDILFRGPAREVVVNP